MHDGKQYVAILTGVGGWGAIGLSNGLTKATAGLGAVNATAALGDFTNLGVGVGTDSYGRVTLDSNQMIGDSTAVRVNVMGHRNDVPGRDVEEMKRWGFAPSIAFGIGTDTMLTLSYLHQRDDNTPQYGVPYFEVTNKRGTQLWLGVHALGMDVYRYSNKCAGLMPLTATG